SRCGDPPVLRARGAPSTATRPYPRRGSAEPPACGPVELRRLNLRIQNDQVERLVEGKRPHLSGGELGVEQPPALDRPLEPRPRMPLRGHVLPAGAERVRRSYTRGARATAESRARSPHG